MSSKVLASPLIRHVSKRGYAQAAPAVKDAKIITSALPSKTIVAGYDNGSPVARVTVAFKAGSRYEPQNELGLAHVLRSAAGFTTKNCSGYMISRKLAQLGASFSSSGDREFVYYTLEATQDNLPEALEYLNHIVSNQEFRPWELSDNIPRLKYDLALLPPQVRAVDLLHKAAYRRGLGNSLYITPRRMGSVSSESLQHFACCNLVPSRCAVTVVGDNQDKASLVAQALQLPEGNPGQGESANYCGGELRKEMGGDLAHVAVATLGAPAGSPQSLALAIAAKALGNGPVTKWGADNSPLAMAVGNIGPFAAAGFNVSYSDSGLFGVILSVPKDEAAAAVKAVAKVLKSPTLNEDAIKAGKNQLKVQVLSEADSGVALSESFAAQALLTGNIKSPADIARDIDQLSSNDVVQALSQAARNKLSMAAVGNIACVPYVDEL